MNCHCLIEFDCLIVVEFDTVDKLIVLIKMKFTWIESKPVVKNYLNWFVLSKVSDFVKKK
jgi:hypothetical protein